MCVVSSLPWLPSLGRRGMGKTVMMANQYLPGCKFISTDVSERDGFMISEMFRCVLDRLTVVDSEPGPKYLVSQGQTFLRVDA